MQQEIRPVLAHGGEGEHAAFVGIDAPAMSSDVAAPDKTDVAPVARRGAEAADHRLARNVGVRQVAGSDAVKYIPPSVKIFQKHFRGEVTLAQHRDTRRKSSIANHDG